MWIISVLVTTGILIFLLVRLFKVEKKVTRQTLTIGIAASTLFGLLIYGAVMYGFRLEYLATELGFEQLWILSLLAQCLGVAGGFWLYRYGKMRVPLKHRAVLTLFDTRLDWCPELEEGDGWLPSPFIDAIAVNAQDFNIDPERFDVLSKELARVGVDLTIVLAVVCANKYLDAEEVETILEELARGAARVRANDFNVREIATKDGAISEAVKNGISPLVEQWGLEIKLVKVEEISPPDEILQEANRLEIEKIQRKAERYEAVTFKQKLDVLMKEYGDKGLTVDKAANLLQAESGKITRTAFDLEGVDSGKIAQAIVALVQGLKGGSS